MVAVAVGLIRVVIAIIAVLVSVVSAVLAVAVVLLPFWVFFAVASAVAHSHP